MQKIYEKLLLLTLGGYMTRKTYIFCFVALLILFVFSFVLIINIKDGQTLKEKSVNNKTIKQLEDQNDDIAHEQETFNFDKMYFVKLDGNRVVVYNMENQLIANTQIYASELGEKEKELLIEGIYCKDAEELFRYLESLTS